LWAAVTASGGELEGDLLSKPLDAGGKEFVLNVVTIKGGSLEAELIADGKPLPGFSRTDCKIVQGDHRKITLAWEGGTKSPRDRIQIRFFLRRARLYGFETKG
jgi:hypothetical protein